VSTTKAAPVGESFLGDCRGEYEACVPYKILWILLRPGRLPPYGRTFIRSMHEVQHRSTLY
jgi:hypothetical protein